MMICSRQEENGTTREFLIEQDEGAEVHVKTQLANRDEWSAAGIITRAGHGIEVAVLSPAAQGQLIKLDRTFRNEVAALQALAVSYRPN